MLSRLFKFLKKFKLGIEVMLLFSLMSNAFFAIYFYNKEKEWITSIPWAYISSAGGSAIGAMFISFIYYSKERERMSGEVFEMLKEHSIFRRLTHNEVLECNFLIGDWKQYKITKKSGADKQKISLEKFQHTSFRQISVKTQKVAHAGEQGDEYYQGYLKKRFENYIEYEVHALEGQSAIIGDFMRNTIYKSNSSHDFTIGKSESINYDNSPYSTMIFMVKDGTELSKLIAVFPNIPWDVLKYAHSFCKRHSNTNTLTLPKNLHSEISFYILNSFVLEHHRGAMKSKTT